jgi:hypothetical protein
MSISSLPPLAVHPLIGFAARMALRGWDDADSAYMLGITDEEFAGLKADPGYDAEYHRTNAARVYALGNLYVLAEDPRTRPAAKARALKAIDAAHEPIVPDPRYARVLGALPNLKERQLTVRLFEKYWSRL